AERIAPVSVRDMMLRLDWRQELLGGAMVTAEAFALYLVAALLLNPTNLLSAFPFWIVLGLLLFGCLVCRVLDELQLWSPEYEIKMAIGVIISLVLAVRFVAFGHCGLLDMGWFSDAIRGLAFLPGSHERHPWGIVALVVYAWWRGRSRAEP